MSTYPFALAISHMNLSCNPVPAHSPCHTLFTTVASFILMTRPHQLSTLSSTLIQVSHRTNFVLLYSLPDYFFLYQTYFSKSLFTQFFRFILFITRQFLITLEEGSLSHPSNSIKTLIVSQLLYFRVTQFSTFPIFTLIYHHSEIFKFTQNFQVSYLKVLSPYSSSFSTTISLFCRII